MLNFLCVLQTYRGFWPELVERSQLNPQTVFDQVLKQRCSSSLKASAKYPPRPARGAYRSTAVVDHPWAVDTVSNSHPSTQTFCLTGSHTCSVRHICECSDATGRRFLPRPCHLRAGLWVKPREQSLEAKDSTASKAS